jgi:hypothetical protein
MNVIPDRIRAEYVFDHDRHAVHLWQREPAKGKDRKITVLFFGNEAYARGIVATINEIPDEQADWSPSPTPFGHVGRPA